MLHGRCGMWDWKSVRLEHQNGVERITDGVAIWKWEEAMWCGACLTCVYWLLDVTKKHVWIKKCDKFLSHYKDSLSIAISVTFPTLLRVLTLTTVVKVEDGWEATPALWGGQCLVRKTGLEIGNDLVLSKICSEYCGWLLQVAKGSQEPTKCPVHQTGQSITWLM
jgi:hypothetical protein